MKKLFLVVMLLSLMTGCLKRDSLENIDIYTTIYPIEYITSRLYGEHSNVYSIYPDGVDPQKFELTNKLIKDYSNAKLIIFDGLGPEKDYVISMYENNKKIKIIDSTLSMEYATSYEELWLDPLNYLMMVQNIKTGFRLYINNQYLKNHIDEEYEKLRIEISSLDAKIKLMVENSASKVIVVSSNVFKFLERYGLKVYSLDENTVTDKTKEEVKELINNDKITYIFVKNDEKDNATVSEILSNTKAQTIKLHSLSNLSEEERKNKDNYLTIMNNNLELIKQEIYK